MCLDKIKWRGRGVGKSGTGYKVLRYDLITKTLHGLYYSLYVYKPRGNRYSTVLPIDEWMIAEKEEKMIKADDGSRYKAGFNIIILSRNDVKTFIPDNTSIITGYKQVLVKVRYRRGYTIIRSKYMKKYFTGKGKTGRGKKGRVFPMQVMIAREMMIPREWAVDALTRQLAK